MSVLVFVENSEGSVKKSSQEAISYGKALNRAIGVLDTDTITTSFPIIHSFNKKLKSH